MSLEWVQVRLAVTWFPSSSENVTNSTLKHTQREKQRAKWTLHNRCRNCRRYAGVANSGIPSCCLALLDQVSSKTPGPPASVWWQGILPLRTHTPLSEGRKSFVPVGRSRNRLIHANVYQNIHCVWESAKLHAPHEAAQKTGTKDLQDEQDVCRHRRQAETAKQSGDHR